MHRGLFITVAICYILQAANAASSTKPKDYTPIKYPGPVQDLSSRYGTEDEVPDECKNKNYCTIKPHDYPQEEFNALFKGTAVRRTRDIIAEDKIEPSCNHSSITLDGYDQKPYPQPTLIIEAFADRQGDPDLIDNCDSKVTFDELYKVRNERGEWKTVVQAPDENFIQKVRLETCTEEGSSCFTAIPFGPSVTTYCKQKTSTWRVLVSDGKNGTVKIKAELPICCSCHYKINNK